MPLRAAARRRAATIVPLAESGAILRSIAVIAASTVQAAWVTISVPGRYQKWLHNQAVAEDQACSVLQSLQDEALANASILTIANAASDPRLASLSEVAGAPFLRSFAVVPLFDAAGAGLGGLTVARAGRSFTAPECRLLGELAAIVAAHYGVRENADPSGPGGYQSGHHGDQHGGRRAFLDQVARLPRRVAEDGTDEASAPWRCVFIDLAAHSYARDVTSALGLVRFEAMIADAMVMLRSAAPAGCQLYPVGVTSFAFLLEPDHGAGWQAIVARLAERMRSTTDANRFPFLLQAGIGVTPFQPGSEHGSDLLRIGSIAAETARGTVPGWSLHDPAVEAAHQRSYRLLSDLHPALHNAGGRQFSLHYQPRIDLQTGAYVGAEALLRWVHPELGAISPAEFIPLAERSALARPLTEWVMEHALAQLARWQQDGMRLNLAVNISAANLDEPDFAERARAQVQRHGVLPELLTFEFTETALLSDADCGLRQLQALAESGITLAIDDFGTGYGNLSFLQRVPARVLKLDRSFISGLPGNQRDAAIVRNTIAMAHELGYRVVAEGVEHAPVGALLAEWGCDEAQGYLFGRPVPSAALVALLQDAAS